MSASDYLDDDDVDSMESVDDDDSDDELGERRAKSPSGAGWVRPRLAKTFVSQTQFQASMARASRDFRTSSSAVRSMSSKVDRMQKELKKTRELAILAPLLSRSNSVTFQTDVGGIKAGTPIPLDASAQDPFKQLLPLLLLGGGLGGDSGCNGDGGADNTMLLALVLARP